MWFVKVDLGSGSVPDRRHANIWCNGDLFNWCLYATLDLIQLYRLYTEPTTFVPPSCDHKTDQVAIGLWKEAAWLPWSFKGGTQDVQQSPWTPWSPSSFERVQNSRRRVAEKVGRSTVARMRQRWRSGMAVVAEWMHNGRPMTAT